MKRAVKGLPAMEASGVFDVISKKFKPYARFTAHTKLPKKGLGTRALKTLRELQRKEEGSWRRGYVSGAVYHGGKKHIAFVNRAYAIGSQSNPLHPDIWPSLPKFEGEIVSMTSKMLHGGEWEHPKREVRDLPDTCRCRARRG